MKVIIREYQEQDREKLAELFYEFQSYIVHIDPLKRHVLKPESSKILLEHTLKKVKDNRGKIYLAESDSAILGFIVGIIREQDEIDKMSNVYTLTGDILELYVEATSRAKGVGTQLLQKMEAYFSASGCTTVWLGVFAPNEPARKFYQKHGYQDRIVNVLKELT